MALYEFKYECGKLEGMICKYSEKRTPKCKCGKQMQEISGMPSVNPGCLNGVNIAT